MRLNEKRVTVKKILKSILSLGLVLTIGFTSINVKAEDNKIDDDTLLSILASYDNILETNPYKDVEGGGFTADNFDIMDLDKDGIPELLINSDVMQIITYDLKNKSTYWTYSTWVLGDTMYYSSKTNRVMTKNTWNGVTRWSICDLVKDENGITTFQYMKDTEFEYYAKNVKVDNKTIKKGYYINGKKCKKSTLVAKMNKLIPSKVELKTPNKNTEENRVKLLGSLDYVKGLK